MPTSQDVSKSLKNYVSNLKEMPSPVRPHSVASHPAGKDTQAMWKRIHLGDSQKLVHTYTAKQLSAVLHDK